VRLSQIPKSYLRAHYLSAKGQSEKHTPKLDQCEVSCLVKGQNMRGAHPRLHPGSDGNLRQEVTGTATFRKA